MRDMKIAPNLAGSTPAMLSGYAEMCGRALARAHAKSGDAALISGYLGNGAAFDEAVLAYAEGYADQVEMDYKLFKKAIRSGRFPIESFPSEIEQAIR
jgi:thiamine monophosphate kinase